MKIKVTEQQLQKVLGWIYGGNDDGLPNEIRGHYADEEWVDIMDNYIKHEEIPASSSHMYQCETCYSKLERMMPVLDYWRTPEGKVRSAQFNEKLRQQIKNIDPGL